MTQPLVIAPSRTVLILYLVIIVTAAVDAQQLTARRYLGTSTVAATATQQVKEEHGGSQELHERVQRELDYLRIDDICKNGDDSYGPCDRERLKDLLLRCPREICLFRMPWRGSTYSGDPNDPKFYIDYDEVYCTKPRTNCDRCWRGRWCNDPPRCIHAGYYRKFGRRERLARVCPGDFADPNDSSERENGYETGFSDPVTAASVSEDVDVGGSSETDIANATVTTEEAPPCPESAAGCTDEGTTFTSGDDMEEESEGDTADSSSNGTNLVVQDGMNNSLPNAPWNPGDRSLLL